MEKNSKSIQYEKHDNNVYVCNKYTVSPKNIPDIFDCNLKNNYHILIIFGSDIPDTCQ